MYNVLANNNARVKKKTKLLRSSDGVNNLRVRTTIYTPNKKINKTIKRSLAKKSLDLLLVFFIFSHAKRTSNYRKTTRIEGK